MKEVVGSKEQKIVQLRNPWGHHKYEASDSSNQARHESTMATLEAKTGFEHEKGTFYVLWEDFLI